jgi:hypothetical protein
MTREKLLEERCKHKSDRMCMWKLHTCSHEDPCGWYCLREIKSVSGYAR